MKILFHGLAGAGTAAGAGAVMGAGAVGTEFASIFRTYGSEVTLIEMLPHILPLEDEEAPPAVSVTAPIPARAAATTEADAVLKSRLTRLTRKGQ